MRMPLIDRKGALWDASAYAIRDYFGTDLGSEALAEFTVQNLGWIRLERRGGTALITVNSKLITREAIAGLCHHLDELQIERAHIATVSERAGYFATGIPAIVERLESLVGKRPARCFLSRAVDAADSPLRNACRELLRSGLMTELLNKQAGLLHELFDGRFTVAEAVNQNPGSPLVLTILGSSYSHLTDTYRRCALGLGFEDHPDAWYGRWIAQQMRQTIDTLGTSFDEVDATICIHGRGPIRLRYDRCILAAQRSDGSRLVLSASRMRDDIDLQSAVREQ